jgi:hypothetical protein
MAIADPAQPAQSNPPHSMVLRMIAGRWLSQAVCVAATLDVPELLWLQPQSAKELARVLGVHAGSLERLLRCLRSAGIVQLDAGAWSVTALGRCLTSAGEPSLRGLARFFGSRAHYAAWGALDYSVRTGGCAFEHINFFPIWESSGFNDAMMGAGAVLFGTLADSYDFSAHASIVDVGAGAGHVLAQILTRSPRTRGVIFDLPGVIAAAQQYIVERDLAARCQCIAGDFFASVPPGAGAYLLTSVLHDWNDERCTRILRNVRAAIPADGVLLIGEHLVDNGGADGLSALLDLEMLVVSPSGRERTAEEFEALLTGCGFTLREMRALTSGAALLIADPV